MSDYNLFLYPEYPSSIEIDIVYELELDLILEASILPTRSTVSNLAVENIIDISCIGKPLFEHSLVISQELGIECVGIKSGYSVSHTSEHIFVQPSHSPKYVTEVRPSENDPIVTSIVDMEVTATKALVSQAEFVAIPDLIAARYSIVDNFKIYKYLINKETGKIVNIHLLVQNIEIESDYEDQIFQYIDESGSISNDLYGYVVYDTKELQVMIDPEVYIHYLLSFDLETLGTDTEEIELDEVRMHGIIDEIKDLPVVNLLNFDTADNSIYGTVLNISELVSLDVAFEYKKFGTTEWIMTDIQEMIAEGNFDDVIEVLVSGEYYVRAVGLFDVGAKSFKVVSNVINSYILAS